MTPLLLFFLAEPSFWDFILKLKDYIIPALTLLIGFKFDWIKEKLNVRQQEQGVQSSSLDNLDKGVDLYKELLDDLSQRYKDKIGQIEIEFKSQLQRLQIEIDELRVLTKDQKDFIAKQSKSLAYYEKKHGKIIE